MTSDFITNNYVATIHWANAQDGFDSTLNIFNYYGFAFSKHSPVQTDAVAKIRFFKENGEEEAPFEKSVPTGSTFHLRVGEHHPGFRGIVTAQLIPAGKMPRLTHKAGQPMRPIATSYFMLYTHQTGHLDFSHELFAVQTKADPKEIVWAQVIYPRPEITPGIVVMNNRPGNRSPEMGSQILFELKTLDSKSLHQSNRINLPPGGSRFFYLSELFPGWVASGNEAMTLVVRGTHIEQPMTFHGHQSGDFNFHHF